MLARGLGRVPSKQMLRRTFSSEIKKVGVIGCGLMGHGIVQLSAANGFDVVAYDVDQKFLDAGMKRISNSVTKLNTKAADKGKISADEAEQKTSTTIARITPSLEFSALGECDLVIEAAMENMDTKRDIFGRLGELCKPTTILASNTSSLPITPMGEFSGRPEFTVGLHFFNPVQLMALVEVIHTTPTKPEVVESAVSFSKALGKTPILCQDTPGFVVNRLLVPYIGSAIQLLDAGVATKDDIDIGMRLGAGHPMGPITLCDYVGLDTTLFILEGWVRDHPDNPAFFVPQSLKDKVAEGKLGRKSGEGYFKWEGDKRI